MSLIFRQSRLINIFFSRKDMYFDKKPQTFTTHREYEAQGENKTFTSRSPPKPIKNHLEECATFLHQQGHTNTELIASFASYMTGLQYCKGSKPEEQGMYMCFPDKNNQYDPNALGIYAGQVRIAFVPKLMAAYIASITSDTVIAVVCYVTGRPSEKYCSCLFNLYAIHPPVAAQVSNFMMD